MKNKKEHIIINSNPWYSAVTEYSHQLIKYIKKRKENYTIITIPRSHLLRKKDLETSSFLLLPLKPQTPMNIIKSLLSITKKVKGLSEGSIIWTFEGREQTICGLSKVLFPWAWKKKKLYRVRGQAAHVKNNMANRFLYNSITDKVVLAAEVIEKRISFPIPKEKKQVMLFCADKKVTNLNSTSKKMNFLPELGIDFNIKTFTVIGRYDPVKGHKNLLEAYLQSQLSQETQLLFIGKSENISAKELLFHAQKHCPKEPTVYKNSENTRIALVCEKKKIFIFDERVPDISSALAYSHWGVIPSLGSEVICRVGVEFIQNGVPVIYHDVGALDEVLKEFKHIKVSPEHLEELKEALEEATKEEISPQEREALIVKALEIYSLNNFDQLIE